MCDYKFFQELFFDVSWIDFVAKNDVVVQSFFSPSFPTLDELI